MHGGEFPGMSQTLVIRVEQPGDEAAIRAVHEAAFGRPAEADLVDRLREAGDVVLSLVALDQGLAGHIAFSRLTVEEPGGPLRAVSLAPVAVMPALQKRGIGSALIRTGLDFLARRREDLVLVLGEPAYYGRFGFSRAIAAGLTTPYDGPYLMGLVLGAASEPPAGVRLRYPLAFAELG